MVSPVIRQIWVVSGALLCLFTMGLMMAYPYSLLPALRLPDSTIKVDLNTGSWLASSPVLAWNIGNVAVFILMDLIGRRRTFGLMLLPAIFGWTLIYFATNVPTLMIALILIGASLGPIKGFGGVIVGEYTNPENRGILLAIKPIFVCLGMMMVHVLSPVLDWRNIALLGALFSMCSVCNAYTWPESPLWLATKGKFKESEKAFFLLRGTNDKSTKEFDKLVRVQKERLAHTETKLKLQEKAVIFLKIFKRKNIIKPLLIMCFARIMLEASGKHTFPVFAKDMLSDINGDSTSLNYYITLTIDVLSVSSCIISAFLVKLINRRSILFISGVPSFILSVCMSGYLFLVSRGFISNTRQWIPLALLVVYFFIVYLGCCMIPYVLLGELFPLHNKGPAFMVFEIYSSIAQTVALKLGPAMIYSIKMQGIFAVNALGLLVPLIYMYFTLPETRNRTLQEIEDFFNNGKYCDENEKSDDDDDDAKILMIGDEKKGVMRV